MTAFDGTQAKATELLSAMCPVGGYLPASDCNFKGTPTPGEVGNGFSQWCNKYGPCLTQLWYEEFCKWFVANSKNYDMTACLSDMQDYPGVVIENGLSILTGHTSTVKAKATPLVCPPSFNPADLLIPTSEAYIRVEQLGSNDVWQGVLFITPTILQCFPNLVLPVTVDSPAGYFPLVATPGTQYRILQCEKINNACSQHYQALSASVSYNGGLSNANSMPLGTLFASGAIQCTTCSGCADTACCIWADSPAPAYENCMLQTYGDNYQSNAIFKNCPCNL